MEANQGPGHTGYILYSYPWQISEKQREYPKSNVVISQETNSWVSGRAGARGGRTPGKDLTGPKLASGIQAGPDDNMPGDSLLRSLPRCTVYGE